METAYRCGAVSVLWWVVGGVLCGLACGMCAGKGCSVRACAGRLSY